MFEHIKTYLLYGNQFCAIEHTVKDGKETLYASILKKSRHNITIKDTFKAVSISVLIHKLPKKQPVCLVINNTQVVTKKLENSTGDHLKLVHQAFPNINLDDFYYESIAQNNRHFISICRKAYIDNLIEAYIKKGIHVLNFSLGHIILSNTTAYIKNTSIFTSNAHITMHNSGIEAISFTNNLKVEHYDINGLETTSNYLLSLSGALSSILNQYSSNTNYQEKQSSLLDTFKQVRFFGWFLKTGLTAILVILLVNFLFFNFYYKNIETLQETAQLNQTSKQRIIKLNTSVKASQKMADDMLKSSISKSSFYINALVHSLPESIMLSEINYQPLKKSIKPDKVIELQNRTIQVAGKSSDSKRYSEWIAFLETLDWITHVDVESYSDSKTFSSFSIKLSIDYDQ